MVRRLLERVGAEPGYMIDLVKYVPETANYNKLIIVAGGASLPNHLDAICDELEKDDKCLLFDVNAHLASNRFDRLSNHEGLKFIFAFDFGHKKSTTVLVEDFMKLPNSYFCIFNRETAWRVADKVFPGEANRIIRFLIHTFSGANTEAKVFDQWRTSPNTTFGQGSLTAALGGIPKHIKDVTVYAADAVTKKNITSAADGKKKRAYQTFAETIRELVPLFDKYLGTRITFI